MPTQTSEFYVTGWGLARGRFGGGKELIAASCFVVLGCASQGNIDKTISTRLDLHSSWRGTGVESVEITRDLLCPILLSLLPVQDVLYEPA